MLSAWTLKYRLFAGRAAVRTADQDDAAGATTAARKRGLRGDRKGSIKEEEPPRPSTRLSHSGTLAKIAAARRTEPAQLSKLVRGELDWIVMRCLEKDRSRRYETASGLARDVERYLKDEPVEACPPTAGYKLRKFARKHQKLLATAAGFAALLLLGVAGSAWQAVRATQAEGVANANAVQAPGQNSKKLSRSRDEAQAPSATRLQGAQRETPGNGRPRFSLRAPCTRPI